MHSSSSIIVLLMLLAAPVFSAPVPSTRQRQGNDQRRHELERTIAEIAERGLTEEGTISQHPSLPDKRGISLFEATGGAGSGVGIIGGDGGGAFGPLDSALSRRDFLQPVGGAGSGVGVIGSDGGGAFGSFNSPPFFQTTGGAGSGVGVIGSSGSGGAFGSLGRRDIFQPVGGAGRGVGIIGSDGGGAFGGLIDRLFRRLEQLELEQLD